MPDHARRWARFALGAGRRHDMGGVAPTSGRTARLGDEDCANGANALFDQGPVRDGRPPLVQPPLSSSQNRPAGHCHMIVDEHCT